MKRIGMNRRVGDKLYFMKRDPFIDSEYRLIEVIVDKSNNTSYYCGYMRFRQRDDYPHDFSGKLVSLSNKEHGQHIVDMYNDALKKKNYLAYYLKDFAWYSLKTEELESVMRTLGKGSEINNYKEEKA